MVLGKGSIEPSASGYVRDWDVIPSQRRDSGLSVGEDDWGGGEERGYDGGKKTKGRKRYLLVDTEGFVLKAKVHNAKVMDHEGIKPLLLLRADAEFPSLKPLRLDACYR